MIPQENSNGQIQVSAEDSAIDSFIEMLQNDIRVLEVKVDREDSLTVASVAYRLKSRAQALGIDVIVRSANQIEVCARRNQIAQMSAEIDLMRHQVDLFVRSCGKQNHRKLESDAIANPC